MTTAKYYALAKTLRTISEQLEKAAREVEQLGSPDVCWNCGNTGKVQHSPAQQEMPCPSCQGSCGRSC